MGFYCFIRDCIKFNRGEKEESIWRNLCVYGMEYKIRLKWKRKIDFIVYGICLFVK